MSSQKEKWFRKVQEARITAQLKVFYYDKKETPLSALEIMDYSYNWYLPWPVIKQSAGQHLN